ncbi:MAG: HAMP domain-containing protein [Sneathiella sp.]|nr:HAMP domain-containing protein [Sneathiella sp.]
MINLKAKIQNLKIRGRLALGFATIVSLLILAIGITTYQVNQVGNNMSRIVDLRVPTANASSSMINNINASLASLRGWMLTGNKKFIKERASVWQQIEQTSSQMDKLSKSWSNTANIAKWQKFKLVLDEFKIAQAKVENIAHSKEEYPATKVLVNEAAPKAAVIIAKITDMINEEQKLEATIERKALLGMMADVRGTMGLSLANIRAFLLTGEPKFVDNFEKLWAKNTKRFDDLTTQSQLMSASQKANFDKLRTAREGFAALPQKMFEIKKSPQSNMSNYTLVVEAAPRAAKLLTILAGKKEATGLRAGGMVTNQRLLLVDDANATLDKIRNLTIAEFIILAVGLVVAGFAISITSRSIIAPINQLAETMKQLANGDTNLQVSALNRKDEIGEMAQAVQIFKENKIAADKAAKEQEELREEVQRSEAAKRKDDEEHARAEAKAIAERQLRAETVNDLTQAFDAEVLEIIKDVSSSLTGLKDTARSLASSAEQSSSQAGTVAAASEQAANNVQTVAAATEELSSSINGLTIRVNQSEKIATTAVTEAEKTNVKISELNISAQKVNEVVKLISDIAEQTNLLALNATIEAARAGDAGKGFAVVAAEVKNLANQTAKATEEITRHISAMQKDTTGAVTAVGEISKTIDGINQITIDISSAIEEQSIATNEISRSIQEATIGNQEVAKHIIDVSKASNDTSVASDHVLDVTENVLHKSDTLNSLVETFLGKIRAA